MVEKYYMSWEELFERVEKIDVKGNRLYGVPRGGMIVSAFLKNATAVHDPADATHIIDDIIDSGRTRKKWQEHFPDIPFWAVIDKEDAKDAHYEWIVFPWESDQDTDKEDNATRLLEHFGKDTTDFNVERVIEFVEKLDD
jgi:hypoxanthine phosphoribosyltransferase